MSPSMNAGYGNILNIFREVPTDASQRAPGRTLLTAGQTLVAAAALGAGLGGQADLAAQERPTRQEIINGVSTLHPHEAATFVRMRGADPSIRDDLVVRSVLCQRMLLDPNYPILAPYNGVPELFCLQTGEAVEKEIAAGRTAKDLLAPPGASAAPPAAAQPGRRPAPGPAAPGTTARAPTAPSATAGAQQGNAPTPPPPAQVGTPAPTPAAPQTVTPAAETPVEGQRAASPDPHFDTSATEELAGHVGGFGLGGFLALAFGFAGGLGGVFYGVGSGLRKPSEDPEASKDEASLDEGRSEGEAQASKGKGNWGVAALDTLGRTVQRTVLMSLLWGTGGAVGGGLGGYVVGDALAGHLGKDGRRVQSEWQTGHDPAHNVQAPPR